MTLAQLRERDLIAEDLIPHRAATEAWIQPLAPRDSAISKYAEWRARTTRTLSSSTIATEAVVQIHQARRELVLHALWLAAPGVRAAVDAARARGVQVLVAGASATRFDLKFQGPRVSYEVQAATAVPLAGVLIIDGVTGLQLADIELRWQGRPVACELAGSLTEAAARALRDALVSQCLAVLDHCATFTGDTKARPLAPTLDLLSALPSFPVYLAGLVFERSVVHVDALQRLAAEHHQGMQLLAAQRALQGLGGALTPELPTAVWEEPWSASWHHIFTEIRGVHPLPLEQVRALLALAPPNLQSAAFIDPAVAAWVPAAPAVANREPFTALRQIAEASAKRWENRAAGSNPAWIAARDRCLAPNELTTDWVVILATEAPSLLGPEETSVWALRLLASLPRPRSLRVIKLWLRSALALRPLIGAQWDTYMIELWRELLVANPDEQDITIELGLECLHVEQLAPLHLARATEPLQVLALRQSFQQKSADTIRAPLWATALRVRLPTLTSTFRAREHGILIKSLVLGVAQWPEGQTVLTAWAQKIADNLRQAADLPALAFWLDELGGLAPALGAELLPRALSALQPHLRGLRDARARNLPTWPTLQNAWRKLGLPLDRLERQASPPASTTGTPPKKGRRR